MLKKEPKISQLIKKQEILTSNLASVRLAIKQQKVKKINEFNFKEYQHITFAERLKKLRVDSGYTQDELANILQRTRTTITNYECYKIEPPITILFNLAQVFNTSIDYLLGLKDK